MDSNEPKIQTHSINLVDSSFTVSEPYTEEMREHTSVSVKPTIEISIDEDRKNAYGFVNLEVDLIDNSTSKDDNQSIILNIDITYFIGFGLLEGDEFEPGDDFFRHLAFKTVWPFFIRDVADYTMRSGYSPIYLDYYETTAANMLDEV